MTGTTAYDLRAPMGAAARVCDSYRVAPSGVAAERGRSRALIAHLTSGQAQRAATSGAFLIGRRTESQPAARGDRHGGPGFTTSRPAASLLRIELQQSIDIIAGLASLLVGLGPVEVRR